MNGIAYGNRRQQGAALFVGAVGVWFFLNRGRIAQGFEQDVGTPTTGTGRVSR